MRETYELEKTAKRVAGRCLDLKMSIFRNHRELMVLTQQLLQTSTGP
jgi:hypothetical protein